MVFGLKMEILTLEKKTSSERATQEEQNEAKFRFIAPSSEELWVPMVVKRTRKVKVVTTANFSRRRCILLPALITPHWKVLRS